MTSREWIKIGWWSVLSCIIWFSHYRHNFTKKKSVLQYMMKFSGFGLLKWKRNKFQTTNMGALHKLTLHIFLLWLVVVAFQSAKYTFFSLKCTFFVFFMKFLYMAAFCSTDAGRDKYEVWNMEALLTVLYFFFNDPKCVLVIQSLDGCFTSR